MGSSCCRPKDQSPKVSLRKVFSRWTHRISSKTETVKISDAEQDGYICKKKDSIVEAMFDSPETEDRHHVTMLLPDAPRVPARKKTGLSNKRVSFQSDVEIMRTASSKSLDRFTVTVIQEEPKSRSKSFDSFFDLFMMSANSDVEYHKKRRTSSLEHLPTEDMQNTTSLIAKLRRDTLGDALDFQAYKKPMVMPKPEQPLIEEEGSEEEEDDDETISSFKLAAKLRRDTLGDALLLTKGKHNDDSPTGSSTEDLEETVKHSRLCSKLRRDTFGDALRQAVHCKACSSMEDITELEQPDVMEEDETDFRIPIPTVEVTPEGKPLNGREPVKPKTETTCVTCKACMSVQHPSETECRRCSSENLVITESNNQSELTPMLPQPQNELSDHTTARKLKVTDEELSQTLEKIRTTGKIEPKEPYNLVYSSCMKGPFASSKESINSKSSSSDSLNVKPMSKADLLNPPDKNLNHLIS